MDTYGFGRRSPNVCWYSLKDNGVVAVVAEVLAVAELSAVDSSFAETTEMRRCLALSWTQSWMRTRKRRMRARRQTREKRKKLDYHWWYAAVAVVDRTRRYC